MKKYYTPQIEEFHVGFEYEFHGMTTGGLMFINGDETTKQYEKEPYIKVWTKETVINPLPSNEMHTTSYIMEDGSTGTLTYPKSFSMFHRSLKDIADLINRDQIRVKYLDRGDLEELGFEISMEKDETYGYYLRGKKRYRENPNTWNFKRFIEIIYSHVKSNPEYIAITLRGSHFQGHMNFDIRSKNDLKQILDKLIVETIPKK